MKLGLLLCTVGALAVPRIELDLSQAQAQASSPDYYNEAVTQSGIRPVSSSDWGTDGDGAKTQADQYVNPHPTDTQFDGAAPNSGDATLTLSNGEKWAGANGPKFFDGGANANASATQYNPDHGYTSSADGQVRLRKLTHSVVDRVHDGGNGEENDFSPAQQPNGDPVKSRQDYVQRCAAKASTTYANCPFPIAKAYDSKEGDISDRIQTRVFRVDYDGIECQSDRGDGKNNKCGCKAAITDACIVENVNFQQRSTYLFKYDVKDRAGNHAEQIVFALIMDDHEKPVIELCRAGKSSDGTFDVSQLINHNCKQNDNPTQDAHGANLDDEERNPMGCKTQTCGTSDCADNTDVFETVEAGSSWTLCNTFKADDNVDGNLKQNVRFDLQRKTKHTWPQEAESDGTWEYVLGRPQDGTTEKTLKDVEFTDVQHAIDISPESSDTRYLITAKVCDDAGVYGQNAMSNCIQVQKAIHIVDSTPPVIVLHGELGKDFSWTQKDGHETVIDVGDDGEAKVYQDKNFHECNLQHCEDSHTTCKQKMQEYLSTDCSETEYTGSQSQSHGNWNVKRTGGAGLGQGHSCDWQQWEAYCEGADSGCVGYVDPGYAVFDSLDTWALNNGANSPKKYSASSSNIPRAWQVDAQGNNKIEPRIFNNITQNTVNDQVTGTYSITYTASDHYGNSAVSKVRNVKVVDRTSPVITLLRDSGPVLKTGEPFHDRGATCWDMCDKSTWATTNTAESKWVVCPDGTNPGSNHLRGLMNHSFAAEGAIGDNVDTLKGTAWTEQQLWGIFQNKTSLSSSPWAEIGECAPGFANETDTPQITGTYIRMYRCVDASGNENWDSRKWVVVDQSKPVITRLGDDTETYDASKTVEYTDKGATCMDSVDGTLSSAVEVSGEVVNMKKVGTYVIRYDCQDSSGNEAIAEYRTIHIEDKSCPEVTLLGSEVNYVEAGYHWIDPGATCKDDLDVNCTVKVYGDTVNIGGAFYERHTCYDIAANYCHEQHNENQFTYAFENDEHQTDMRDFATATDKSTAEKCEFPYNDGFYWITQKGPGGAAVRQRVLCLFDEQNKNSPEGAVTLTTCDGTWNHASDPVCSTSCNGNFGAEWQTYVAAGKWAQDDDVDTKDAKEFFDSQVYGTWSDWANDEAKWLCTVTNSDSEARYFPNDSADPSGDHVSIDHAEVGKYVIEYHARDSSGNDQCQVKKRTVIVRDTLPPIISLHLKPKSEDGLDTLSNGQDVNEARDGLAENGSASGQRLIYVGDKEAHAPKEWNQGNHFVRTQPGDDANEDAFESNPIFSATNNPTYNRDYVRSNLMAEQQAASPNTWFVLGAAMGVAGIALVALSGKRQPVVVEV